MRIAVGPGHAGFDKKELITDHLHKAGHEVDDLGTLTEVDGQAGPS